MSTIDRRKWLAVVLLVGAGAPEAAKPIKKAASKIKAAAKNERAPKPALLPQKTPVESAETSVPTENYQPAKDVKVQLPDGAHKVAENRYRAPSSFENTLKYYKNVYSVASYPRRAIINQPGIKAMHIANSGGRGNWEGLNIYEANDEVRIYVVPAQESGKKKRAK